VSHTHTNVPHALIHSFIGGWLLDKHNPIMSTIFNPLGYSDELFCERGELITWPTTARKVLRAFVNDEVVDRDAPMPEPVL
jgi:hypothetical protein